MTWQNDIGEFFCMPARQEPFRFPNRSAKEPPSSVPVNGLRTPDAIQLATSIGSGASSFLTNDSRLPSLPQLKVLVLNRLAPTAP